MCFTGEDGTALEVYSRGLDALEDLIEAVNGRPVLVAYWYRYDNARNKGRLNQQDIRYAAIDSFEKRTCQELRELAQSLRSPNLQGQVDGSQSTEAAFEKELMMLVEEEKRLHADIKKMVALKTQTNQVIGQVKDPLNRSMLKMR